VRRFLVSVAAIAVVAAACGDAAPEQGTSVSPGATSQSETAVATPSESEIPTPSVEPSPPPAAIPEGVPAAYGADVPARDLPVDELIPPGDEVTGVDRASTGDGEAVVIAFATPGPDPFRQARGFVVWRREPGSDPPWRATFGLAHGKREGVLAIAVDATDLTDDGSDDALIREETGGTGACATYRVVDLAAGAPIWQRSVCDAQIQPNPDPIGLFEVARIYGPDDPHCCPSAIRERVLAWDGDRFTVVSQKITPV
jgi:hypothetical protein